MKSMGGRTPVFYFFQQDANRDYNVTTLAPAPQPPVIRDVLAALPLDLSPGLFHFRFKSEMPEGDEKIVAWIDINNLAAKVPQINGAIYIKILKLKEPGQNKLFHLDKLRKADLVKQGAHHSHSPLSAPKPTQNHPSPQPKVPTNTNNTPTPPPKTPVQVPPQSMTQQPRNPNNNPPPPMQTLPKQPVKQPQVAPPTSVAQGNLMSFESAPPPQRPKIPSTTATVEQNLQIFKNQFKQEQQHKQNERIAQEELQDRLRKWGYTDLKKINNTTTLLATLHQIWPEWQQVSLSDMLKPEQVNALFKKAVIKVHPDKNRHRHFKEKYLSKRVFELLNESRKH